MGIQSMRLSMAGAKGGFVSIMSEETYQSLVFSEKDSNAGVDFADRQ